MQSRAEVVDIGRGDAVIFPVHHRPVQGTRGTLPRQHAPRRQPAKVRQAPHPRHHLSRCKVGCRCEVSVQVFQPGPGGKRKCPVMTMNSNSMSSSRVPAAPIDCGRPSCGSCQRLPSDSHDVRARVRHIVDDDDRRGPWVCFSAGQHLARTSSVCAATRRAGPRGLVLCGSAVIFRIYGCTPARKEALASRFGLTKTPVIDVPVRTLQPPLLGIGLESVAVRLHVVTLTSFCRSIGKMDFGLFHLNEHLCAVGPDHDNQVQTLDVRARGPGTSPGLGNDSG